MSASETLEKGNAKIMTKMFVKKPYLTLVAIVIVLAFGGVSLSKMQTNLMPDMDMPYLAVITTEIGASPQKVQDNVTKPIEDALGTISGVNKVSSTSSSNYGMTMLEFSDDTDMDAALVRVSKALNSLDLPDDCGTPNIMEISADMLATMSVSVGYDGKDIKDVTAFTDKVVIPYLKRQNGVASITETGNINDTIEVRLNQKKIDKVNKDILTHTNKKLRDAQKKIDKAQKKLDEGNSKLKEQEGNLSSKQDDTTSKLAKASVALNQAQAMKASYESTLTSLKANKAALSAEKKAYKDAKILDTYKSLNTMFATFNEKLGEAAKMSEITIPSDVKDAIDNPSEFNEFKTWLTKMGQGDSVKKLTVASMKKVYNIAEVRMPQIDTELANLKTEIKVAQAMVDKINQKMKGMDKKQEQAVAGGYQASAGFGSAQAQMQAGKKEIENAKKELKNAQKQLDESKDAALENANLDALLTLDTLSQLITAQNFSMPAGYIDDKNDDQWLIQIGENYESAKQIKNMVLTKVKGVGSIKISDVANVVTVDNVGDQYAKINGKDSVMLAIYKSSTASTSDVTNALTDSFKELEGKYKGLSITPLSNQGDFIKNIISSVLSSIVMGAILAIIVLALFLKDVRPTVVVAFSIPFSVLFALVIMYFTGININVMSLAGLCLGIGMLVDNSVVVMENIYRLRNKGLSAPRAAVQGTKQVLGPIIASTITTICVFLPMVYTSGTVSQMLIPFSFTISYSLIASLLVAITVVPTLGSITLKKVKNPKHKLFDKIKDAYGESLEFFLRHKVVPLVIAVALLVVCVWKLSEMGLVMMDSMESNQISVSLEVDKKESKQSAYKTADKVMNAIMKVDGIDKVGVTDGNASAMSGSLGGASDNYTSFIFNIITKSDIKTTKQFRKIRKTIEKNTKDIKCKELTVSSSALGSMGSMMEQGLEVNIYGDDMDKLVDISNDFKKMMNDIDGCSGAKNGLEDADKQLHLTLDKNKVANAGLTVAGIYQQLAARINTDKTSITLNVDDTDVDVKLVNKTDELTYENLMKADITATTKDSNGNDKKKTYKLSKFAKIDEGKTAQTLSRENQSQMLTVSADVDESENATLLSRQLQKKIDKYNMPEGYSAEIGGQATQVKDMMIQLVQALALGLLLIYLVMVAQFQSLLSPFIIIFTIPLAFTGGMLGLLLFGQSISAMSMMGFMILMGTVVNNGIVFVDYANRLRIGGVEKRRALVATGKTRMRPILMTALTTILSMSVMVFSQDAGNAMQQGMAIVVCFGLIYSTFMTLYIVPIMYDILYRRQPKDIDTGSDDMDDIPDEAQDYLTDGE